MRYCLKVIQDRTACFHLFGFYIYVLRQPQRTKSAMEDSHNFLCTYIHSLPLEIATLPINNSIQLLTGFEYKSSFVSPEDSYCPRSQTITVLLFTFIFSKHSYSLFPFTYPLNVFNILALQVPEFGRRLDILMSISHDLFNQ